VGYASRRLDNVEWDTLDKTVFSVCDVGDEGNDLKYWLSRTPQERFEAIEYMRRVLYGHDAASPTFQRVFEIVDLAQD